MLSDTTELGRPGTGWWTEGETLDGKPPLARCPAPQPGAASGAQGTLRGVHRQRPSSGAGRAGAESVCRCRGTEPR